MEPAQDFVTMSKQ